MALVAAHVTKEQVFNFLAHHQAIQQHCRQPRQSEQRRQSQRAARPCESRRRSRAGESRVATTAPRPAVAPPVRTGAALAAPSRQPTLTGPPLRLRPPASTLRLRRSAAAGGAASPPPLCAPRRRGRRLLPQPVSLLPAARLLPADPDR